MSCPICEWWGDKVWSGKGKYRDAAGHHPDCVFYQEEGKDDGADTQVQSS